jgi:hypothetical protein
LTEDENEKPVNVRVGVLQPGPGMDDYIRDPDYSVEAYF